LPYFKHGVIVNGESPFAFGVRNVFEGETENSR
jgi:hypothetical protein